MPATPATTLTILVMAPTGVMATTNGSRTEWTAFKYGTELEAEPFGPSSILCLQTAT